MSITDQHKKEACTNAVNDKPQSSISILNQLIDDKEGVYRIQFGDKVRYFTITTDVFDDDTMCRPYLLIPKLPNLSEGGWTKMSTVRSPTGSLEVTTTNDPLPAVQNVWHRRRIDALTLKRSKRYRSTVHEVLYNGEPAIAKIAAFAWQVPGMERETWAYSVLDQYQRQHPSEPLISPRVLGHLTEEGRVMGLLLEKLEGTFASMDNFVACENTLHRLHATGLVHYDINRYNFIVEEDSGQVKVVDFEHAAGFEEEELAWSSSR